ncbi:MAG: DUF2207 domain-containing protein [Cyclobacteriaceae bacterium]|nr:DUF2207 domain-containing protein [Cyclobacteriaceae bacterium]
MKLKLLALSCSLLLAVSSVRAQELVFTTASAKIFTHEELGGLIKQATHNAIGDLKIPAPVFEANYKKYERHLWREARPAIVQAFKWVESTSSASSREKTIGLYKQQLFRAVRDVVLGNPAFKNLVAFDQTDRILSFTNKMKVQRDGWIIVNETITIYNGNGNQSDRYLQTYPGPSRVNNDIQRGLERTFPTDYTNEHGLQTTVPFEVTGVTKNGQAENYKVVKYGNGYLVRIGSADVYLEDGLYEYELTYKTKFQLIFKQNKTELYWNVNGNGWIFTTDSVASTITFPAGAKIFEHACYTGVEGSTTRNCFGKIENDSTISFSSTQPLNSYEGLTVAAAIQPGIISAPSLADMSYNLAAANWQLTVVIFIVLIVFCINLFNWIKFGRDPRQGAIYPQFEPPQQLSPADAGFVYNQKYRPEQFSAALVDLAVKNAIRIDVKKEGNFFKKNTYTFRKAKEASQVKSFAKNTYEWNLESLYGINANGTYNPTLESLSDSLRKKLKANLQADSAGNQRRRGFFALNEGAASWGFGAWFIAFIFGIFVIAEASTYVPVITVVAVLFLGLVSQIVFRRIMPAYTKQGRKLMDDLMGFRMYLATAEENRFDKLNPPEKNLELFERFLPYAIALNCQQAWSAKFESILKAAIANKTYQPAYYSGDMSDNLSFTSLSESFSSNLSSTIASSSSAPSDSSSSGSDGGGSSGGGGGGGGGGGW